MNSRALLIGVGLVCFGLGIMIGRWSQPAPIAPAAEDATLSGLSSADLNKSVTAADSLQRETAIEPEHTSTHLISMQDRLKFLRWQKSVGLPYRLVLGTNIISSSRLNPAFVAMLELTQSEQSQLLASIGQVRDQLNVAAVAVARTELIDNPDKLGIRVPPLPEVGGRVHDTLLSSIESVLGEDRFQIFNEVARDLLKTCSTGLV